MKIYKNGKDITLSTNDFIAAGGQGSVYKKNGEILKIYTDPLDPNFLTKMKELSVLSNSNILKPEYPLYDSSNVLIGFTMKYIDDTEALPLFFTTSYRDRNSISSENTITLVENIAQTMQYIHENKILIVDANEFNYLVAKSDKVTPYFIDVDSYQTPSFPATVILPSIRDFTQRQFTELSDWYSFAVIAFQLFTGIHPYKGNHKDFKKDDIEARCKKHTSVFNSEVKYPPVVRSFDLIPSNYKQWFFDLFENGKRSLPPTVSGTITIKAQETRVSNKLIITEVVDFPEKITKTYWIAGMRIVQGKTIVMIENAIYYIEKNEKYTHFIHFNGSFHKVYVRKGKFFLDDADMGINADKLFVVDNRVYTLDGEFFREISMLMAMGKALVSVRNSWSILPQSTVVYKNCIYNGVFKKNYFYIPYEEGACTMVDIKMDGVRVVDAAYDRYTLYVMTFYQGTYSRSVFKFDKKMEIVDHSTEDDVGLSEINMTSLGNGVNLLLVDDDIHLTVPMKTEQKVVTGVGLPDSAVLTNDGNSAYYFYENKLFSIKMS